MLLNTVAEGERGKQGGDHFLPVKKIGTQIPYKKHAPGEVAPSDRMDGYVKPSFLSWQITDWESRTNRQYSQVRRGICGRDPSKK